MKAFAKITYICDIYENSMLVIYISTKLYVCIYTVNTPVTNH